MNTFELEFMEGSWLDCNSSWQIKTFKSYK